MILPVLLAFAAFGATAQAASGGGIVGPGPFETIVSRSGYRVAVSISPNQGGLLNNRFVVRCTRTGKPVVGVVSMRFTMRAMPMPPLGLSLRSSAPGVYRGTGLKLTMPGLWEIRIHLAPRRATPLEIVLLDRVVV